MCVYVCACVRAFVRMHQRLDRSSTDSRHTSLSLTHTHLRTHTHPHAQQITAILLAKSEWSTLNAAAAP